MAAEHTQEALTPASYIAHHLGFNVQNVGDAGGFWRINIDTLFTSIFLGFLVIGLSGKIRIHTCPSRFMKRVIAIRAASI